MGRTKTQAGKDRAAREKERRRKQLKAAIVASLAATVDEVAGAVAPQGPTLTLQQAFGALKDIQDTNKALQDKIEALESQLKDANRSKNVLEHRGNKFRNELKKTTGRRRGLKKDIEVGCRALNSLARRVQDTEKENRKLRQVVDYLIKHPPHNGVYFDEHLRTWVSWEDDATQTQQHGMAEESHAAGGGIAATGQRVTEPQ